MVNTIASVIFGGIVDFVDALSAAALDFGASVPFVGYSLVFVDSIFVLVADVCHRRDLCNLCVG